jgi:hypothetical protein
LVKYLDRKRGCEQRVLKNGWMGFEEWLSGLVDEVEMSWVCGGGGDGAGSGGTGVVTWAGVGARETGGESGTVEETGRAEGRHKRGEGCQQSLRLSLFSSHAEGEVEGGDGGLVMVVLRGEVVHAELSSGRVEMTATEAAAGGEDAEAWDTEWVASWSRTAMLGAVVDSEVAVAGSSRTASCEWCVSAQGSDASDAIAGEEEGVRRGRDRRRGRAVVGVMEGCWERTAKGLAVWGRVGRVDVWVCRVRGDRGRTRVGWRRGTVRDLGARGAVCFALVSVGDDGWCGRVWIPVSTRMVWRETSSELLVEEEEEMEEDDADVREKEGGRGVASDAGEGDECNEVGWVGRGGVGVGRGSMGSEGKVERGVGGKEGETSCREVWRTLLSDATSQEWVRERKGGEGESGEWMGGGPACSKRVDSWWMTKDREERASVVSIGWPHWGEDDTEVSGGPSEYNVEVMLTGQGLTLQPLGLTLR